MTRLASELTNQKFITSATLTGPMQTVRYDQKQLIYSVAVDAYVTPPHVQACRGSIRVPGDVKSSILILIEVVDGFHQQPTLHLDFQKCIDSVSVAELVDRSTFKACDNSFNQGVIVQLVSLNRLERSNESVANQVTARLCSAANFQKRTSSMSEFKFDDFDCISPCFGRLSLPQKKRRKNRRDRANRLRPAGVQTGPRRKIDGPSDDDECRNKKDECYSPETEGVEQFFPHIVFNYEKGILA